MSRRPNSSRKRKYDCHPHAAHGQSPEADSEVSWLMTSDHHQEHTDTHTSADDPTLFIEAREADIIHDQESTALSLEAPDDASGDPNGTGKGSGLIQWQALGVNEITWVDRFDARLLLTELPNAAYNPLHDRSSAETSSLSPTGWSDLPSDTEDTFFLSPSEIEDFHRTKRRRMLDEDREQRLRMLREADAVKDDEADEDPIWGGSDEEASEEQRTLMRRTATHILTSGNPAQLEMRILANHGADKRFAFLRGRWKSEWKKQMEDARKDELQREEEEERLKATAASHVGLGGLAGYGDSEDESEEAENEDGSVNGAVLQKDPIVHGESQQLGTHKPKENSDIMEARRARARLWAAKRRAEKVSEPV